MSDEAWEDERDRLYEMADESAKSARLAALREVREMVVRRVLMWDSDSEMSFDRRREAGTIRDEIDRMIAEAEKR